jgi:hypothetical protein
MVVFIFHVVVLFQSSCNSCYMENNHEDGAMDLDATPTMMEIMPVDDGDHVRALEMKIKGAKTKGPYHIAYELHVMLILLCILYCLDRDGSIIR